MNLLIHPSIHRLSCIVQSSIIHLSIHPSFNPSNHSSIINSSIHPSIHPLINLVPRVMMLTLIERTRIIWKTRDYNNANKERLSANELMNLRVRPTTTLPDVVAVALPRSSTTGSIRFPFPCFDDQNARRANTLMHHRSLLPSYFPRQHKVADGTRLSLTLAVLFVSFRFLHDTQDSCPPISRPAAVVAAYLQYVRKEQASC